MKPWMMLLLLTGPAWSAPQWDQPFLVNGAHVGEPYATVASGWGRPETGLSNAAVWEIQGYGPVAFMRLCRQPQGDDAWNVTAVRGTELQQGDTVLVRRGDTAHDAAVALGGAADQVEALASAPGHAHLRWTWHRARLAWPVYAQTMWYDRLNVQVELSDDRVASVMVLQDNSQAEGVQPPPVDDGSVLGPIVSNVLRPPFGPPGTGPEGLAALLQGNGYADERAARLSLSFRTWELLFRHQWADLQELWVDDELNRSAFSVDAAGTASFLQNGFFSTNALPYGGSWSGLISQLESWRSGQPDSPLPALALAVGQANEALSTGLRSRPNRAAIEAANLSLDSAMSRMAKAPSLLRFDGLLATMLCQSVSGDLSHLTELYDQAHGLRPASLMPAGSGVAALAWHRDEPACLAFADHVQGDEARTLALAWPYGNELPDSARLVAWWPRLRAGFNGLKPTPEVLNRLAFWADAAGDQSTARSAFDHLGGDWSRSVWPSWSSFLQARERAGAGPLRAATVLRRGSETLHGDTPWHAAAAFRFDVEALLQQQRFADLEALAAGLPDTGDAARTQDDLIRTLSQQPWVGKAAWEVRLGLLDRWMAAYPHSWVARVVAAGTWIGYAWNARGSGYADTVTPEGWRIFSARLAVAKALLDEAESMGCRALALYRARMTLAMAGATPHDTFDTAFRESVATHPHSTAPYVAKAYDLLPRWNGAPGELEAFAAQSADDTRSWLGDGLYAVLTDLVVSAGPDGVVVPANGPRQSGYGRYLQQGDLFRRHPLSKNRILEGFQDLLRHPDPRTRLARLNAFARLTRLMDNGPEARKLVLLLGDEWDPRGWTYDEFKSWQAWADPGYRTPPEGPALVVAGAGHDRAGVWVQVLFRHCSGPVEAKLATGVSTSPSVAATIVRFGNHRLTLRWPKHTPGICRVAARHGADHFPWETVTVP
ncbi:MAG TPA: hypothetical protein VGO93_19110 [Candidatus Xenobia bacterium]